MEQESFFKVLDAIGVQKLYDYSKLMKQFESVNNNYQYKNSIAKVQAGYQLRTNPIDVRGENTYKNHISNSISAIIAEKRISDFIEKIQNNQIEDVKTATLELQEIVKAYKLYFNLSNFDTEVKNKKQNNDTLNYAANLLEYRRNKQAIYRFWNEYIRSVKHNLDRSFTDDTIEKERYKASVEKADKLIHGEKITADNKIEIFIFLFMICVFIYELLDGKDLMTIDINSYITHAKDLIKNVLAGVLANNFPKVKSHEKKD